MAHFNDSTNIEVIEGKITDVEIKSPETAVVTAAKRILTTDNKYSNLKIIGKPTFIQSNTKKHLVYVIVDSSAMAVQGPVVATATHSFYQDTLINHTLEDKFYEFKKILDWMVQQQIIKADAETKAAETKAAETKAAATAATATAATAAAATPAAATPATAVPIPALHYDDEFKTHIFLLRAALKIPYASNSLDGPIPAWASKIINDSDISDACKMENGIITPDCISKRIKNKIIQLDIHSNENDLLNDPQFTKYIELVKTKNDLLERIENPPISGITPTIKTKMDANKEDLIKTNKLIEELYGDHIVQIANSNKISTFPITNPFVAMANRSRTNATFANPGNSNILRKNSQIVKRLVPQEITGMMNTGSDSVKSDTKKVVNKILTSLYYCGQSSSLGDPKCSPAQVLGEIREYQHWKMQQAQKDRKLQYPDIMNWKLIQKMFDSIKNAIAGRTPGPSQGPGPGSGSGSGPVTAFPAFPAGPAGPAFPGHKFGGPIGFPLGPISI